MCLSVVVSQSTADRISTYVLSPLPNFLLRSSRLIVLSTFSVCSNIFSNPLIWICSTCSIEFIFSLSLCKEVSSRNSNSVKSFSEHSPGRRERGGGVIAVCTWRACGFCWLWRLLYVRGWMKRRIGVQLWPCCLESPLLFHSHKLAWLQLDCGLRSRDLDLLQPLVL